MKTCAAKKKKVWAFELPNKKATKIAVYTKGQTIGTFREGDTQHYPFYIITNLFDAQGQLIRPRKIGFVAIADVQPNPEIPPKTPEQMAAEAQAKAIAQANKQAAEAQAKAIAQAEQQAAEAQAKAMENIALWAGDAIVGQQPMPMGSPIFASPDHPAELCRVASNTGFVLLVRNTNPAVLNEKNGRRRVRFHLQEIGILPGSTQPLEGWITV